jgi:hypothetical protein
VFFRQGLTLLPCQPASDQILLSLLPNSWDYRCKPPCPTRFWDRISLTFAWTILKPQSSYFPLLSSWDYKCAALHLSCKNSYYLLSEAVGNSWCLVMFSFNLSVFLWRISKNQRNMDLVIVNSVTIILIS